MEQREPVGIAQTPPHRVHVRAVVLDSDVLEHADRQHAIERLVELAVVLHADLDREAGAQLPGVGRLLVRHGHADDVASGVLGEVPGGGAPAAPDVEYAHARLEHQLVANQLQLGELRGAEVVSCTPVAAAVDHRIAEHDLVQFVADVVMPLADLERAATGLQVADLGFGDPEQRAGSDQAPGDLCPVGPFDHLVDRVAVPPPVHVGLAETERAGGEDPLVEPFVVDAHVPRTVAVDSDVSRLDEPIEIAPQP